MKVLFASYGGGHVRSLLPVARLMHELGHDVKFLAFTTAILELKDESFSCLTYSDFFEGADVRAAGEVLVESVEGGMLPFDESVIYLGRNFLDLAEDFGWGTAKEMFAESGRLIFNPLKSMSKILGALKPDVVVSTSSPRSERAIIEAAHSRGIPSIALSDLFVERPLTWFSKSDFASKICVPSESARQILVGSGRSQSDIVVTGNPAFDLLVEAAKSQSKVLKGSYRVLWASQPEPSYFVETGAHGDPNLPIKIEQQLFEIFEARREWQLVVRNHPNEHARVYPEFVEVSHKDQELFELLKSIDVVVTCTSIVGFEALLLGKGFLTIDKSVLSEILPFARYGYSKSVPDIHDIEEGLDEFFSTREAPDVGYTIENATDNVANVILSVNAAVKR